MTQALHRRAALGLAAAAPLVAVDARAAPASDFGPPPGFTSAHARGLHYVRGGQGPVVILLHGFPEDWTEYRALLPRLAKRFTVVAVDLPGFGRSAPSTGGYDKASLSAQVRGLAEALRLERPYLVGHDLGALTTYAYVRQFPESLRGAMVLDVPMPGIAGWDEANSQPGLWHIGFIQTPGGFAEKLVTGRQDVFLGWFYDIGKFTPEHRAYYARIYGAPQLHAAFEAYRAFPKDVEWNAAQTAPNATPLTMGVGEKSFFLKLQPTFLEGFRAKGMIRVEGAQVPGAGHYVAADNPAGLAELIERRAGV